MAESRARKTLVVELDLTEEEAKWLRGLLQNYLGEGEEPKEHYDYRNALWHALASSLKRG
jgi:hypothetical protein